MAEKSNKELRLLQIFAARLVLEVFGGGGAIWGPSEVVWLRTPETVEFWRTVVQVVAGIFFIRFILQIIDFVSNKDHGAERSNARLIQVFSAKVVLEICGGCGAIWGSSEALTLRRPETQEFWRSWALIVGAIFVARFFFQLKDFMNEMAGRPASTVGMNPYLRFYQIFAAKFVLEVLGGAGAFWGYSEACRFRTKETQEFWRFVALTGGFIFYLRMLFQMKDYVIELHYPGRILKMTRHQWFRLFHIFSARLVLEVFGGAGAIWGFSEALTLRRPETQDFWRFNALTVGFIFSVRFASQIKDYLLECMEENIKVAKAENTDLEFTPGETTALLT